MGKKPENKDQTQKRRTSEPKVRLKTATLVALSGLASYGAVRAVAATATLPIIARLVRAIELTVNTTMDFGTLAMTVDRAGYATLDPEVDRLVFDKSSSLSLAGGKPAAGRLMIKGSEFPVAVSVEDQTVNLTNGTNTVAVTNFNLVTAQGGRRATFTPTQNTYSITIPVGATIRTRTGQLSGTYVGTTRLFASYQ